MIFLNQEPLIGERQSLIPKFSKGQWMKYSSDIHNNNYLCGECPCSVVNVPVLDSYVLVWCGYQIRSGNSIHDNFPTKLSANCSKSRLLIEQK